MYTVTLTATNACGMDVAIFTLTVTDAYSPTTAIRPAAISQVGIGVVGARAIANLRFTESQIRRIDAVPRPCSG